MPRMLSNCCQGTCFNHASICGLAGGSFYLNKRVLF
jgi:hypothetical protein